MKSTCYLLLCLLVSFCSASNAASNAGSWGDDLFRFANANCFFWYFKETNQPTSEIKKIAGGIVETSHYSANTFRKVAKLVESYQPIIKTKQKIDIRLLRCFYMHEDSDFHNRIIEITDSKE